jgi:hypothetical protein
MSRGGRARDLLSSSEPGLGGGEFEQRAPQAHHEFLLSINVPENQVLKIRKWASGLSHAK